MAELATNVRYIKGIGEQRSRVLARLGINTLRDLVSYFPRDYEDRRVMRSIAAASVGETVCIRGMVATSPQLSRVRKGLELVKFRIVDETGAIDVTYFNQKYVKDQLRLGETYIFYGKLGGFPSRKTLSNPIFEREDASGNVTGRIVPIYRLTAGISQKILMNAISQGLAACGDNFPDHLPSGIREEYELAQARFSYENIHFPRDFGALELARRRLIFEELFVLSCALGVLKGRRSGKNGIRFSETDMEEFYSSLPFTPMGAQRRAVADAVRDMCSGKPMNRLIQGDVGSGKTLVAAACIWFAWKNGYQSAFMAPTEILADQHFKTLCEFLEPFGLRVGKLTGSMSAKNKRETRDALALGILDLVVGTHALLSDNIEFNQLGLVITDEQHRFGVEQRSSLSAKGENPHVLVMSATPIPRTLALIIYGDLDVSIIDEMPPGRQKVDTYVVGEEIRPRIEKFIRRLVSEGRQVFIVCPMIEENEELPQDLKSAREWAAHLQKRVYPDLKIACIHGKMKPKDKDALMAAFVAGEYHILVSTTVIEVGIDVPNAALMIVENAERFGLSQLHQLRGRVGRSVYKSYCILFSNSTDDEARARLNVMCKTNDGFKIAEEDLRLRGPGDFFGSRQHGLPEMRIADLCTDINILQTAQDAAHQLLKEDPQLQHPQNAPLLARIRELFEIRGEIFN